MLKIEVIKFEAQDVITSSIACVCNSNCWTHHENYSDDRVADHTRGDVKCYADSHPNCYKPGEGPD